jgi:hypothetical protein
MSEETGKGQTGRAEPEGWPLKEVWEKYEDIAMHFNDLLIRLSTQALAAVAAISTLVTIFGKTGADPKLSWELAALVFSLLSVFWIAIWIIDFCYYNRLLIGAVAAILDIETLSKDAIYIRQIDISTKIERAVAREGKSLPSDWYRFFNLHLGTWAFYIFVFSALIGGIWFSLGESQRNPNPSQSTFSAPG